MRACDLQHSVKSLQAVESEGWYGEGGGRWGSEWGTRVHLWQMHVDVWQNQYNIVKLKKIIKK